MKKNLIFLFLVIGMCAHSQVAINNTGSLPDSSAMLDVNSTNKGMLIPRMTAAQREAIVSPAAGLLIFCTDDNLIYSNNGTPDEPWWLIINSKWYSNGPNIYFAGGKVGIGTSIPSAVLDVIGGNNWDLVNGDGDFRLGNSQYKIKMGIALGGGGAGAAGIMQYGQPGGYNVLKLGAQGNYLLFLNGESQRVGIGTGTDSPMATLDIQGTLRVSDGTEGAGLVLTSDGDGIASWARATIGCIDYDGNAYPTFTIGTQVWMAENLRVTHYQNGDAIPNVTNNAAWEVLTTGAYCWYSNNQSTNAKYGILYNWQAVNDNRGLCPGEWHVPTDAEWTTLTTYLGGESVAGGKMKSVSALWNPGFPNVDASNNSGFSGLPSGGRDNFGSFHDISNYGNWWSSSENDSYVAWSRNLSRTGPEVVRYDGDKRYGFSVRCLRNY